MKMISMRLGPLIRLRVYIHNHLIQNNLTLIFCSLSETREHGIQIYTRSTGASRPNQNSGFREIVGISAYISILRFLDSYHFHA